MLSQIEKFKSRREYVFLLVIFGTYTVWKFFSFYVKNTSGLAHECWIRFIIALGSAYAFVTSNILNFFGEKTISKGITVFYPLPNKSILVEDHCLAIPVTIIFVGSIMGFSGPWKHKIWFIFMGVSLIILINIIRLVLLCYTFVHCSAYFFNINHSIVYVVVTYSLVFLLILWWVKQFSSLNPRHSANS